VRKTRGRQSRSLGGEADRPIAPEIDHFGIGPNGELDGNGGALAFLKVSAITERKTFLTVMARLLPITIKTAPPLKGRSAA
jgi:hypothetical protein